MIQKRIRETIQTWDWKTIRQVSILLVLLSAVFLVVFKFPDWKREVVASKLDNQTTADIISFIPLEEMSQTEMGNNLILHAIEITYRFDWNGKQFVRTEKVPNTIKNQPFIGKVMNRSIETCQVQFQSKNPVESQLVTD